jgi:hypothetical protein
MPRPLLWISRLIRCKMPLPLIVLRSRSAASRICFASSAVHHVRFECSSLLPEFQGNDMLIAINYKLLSSRLSHSSGVRSISLHPHISHLPSASMVEHDED